MPDVGAATDRIGKVKEETPESKEQQRVKFQTHKKQKFLNDPELHIYWEHYKKLRKLTGSLKELNRESHKLLIIEVTQFIILV